mmetsp:Transcript_15312/g.21849  ORF Transcript_15312/g.21849 Transcript_15312/m.21849 type:complete len:420 (+) Transcript_15312:170-1429(+)
MDKEDNRKNEGVSFTSEVDSKASSKRPKMYHPIILKYKCRGALYISNGNENSSDTGNQSEDSSWFQKISGNSKKGAKDSMSPTKSPSWGTPRCIGIESRLKTVQRLPPATEADALSTFVRWQGGPDMNVRIYSSKNNQLHGAFGGSHIGTSKRNTKHAESKNDSKGGDEAFGEQNETRSISSTPVIIDRYAPDLSSEYDSDTSNSKNTEPQPFPTMRFYGSTDVTLLMVRDARRRDAGLVAVAPENTLGVTVRESGDIDDHKGIGRVDKLSTLRVGNLEVTVGTGEEIIDDGEENGKHRAGHNNSESGKENESKRKQVLEQQTKHSKEQNQSNNHTSKGNIGSIINNDYYNRFKDSLKRTANGIKGNAKLLSDELQDDFLNRTIKGGEKVAKNFEKTLDRTCKTFVSVLNFWSDDDDSR